MDSKSGSSKLISSKAATVDPESETDGIIWCFGFLYLRMEERIQKVNVLTHKRTLLISTFPMTNTYELATLHIPFYYTTLHR